MTVAVSGNTHLRIIKYIENVITGKTSYAVATMTGWPLWNICVTNDHGYVPLVANTFRSFPLSWLITGFVTRLTRQVFTSGAGTAYPSGFSGVRVTRSLFLYVSFVDRYLSFCTFSFGHCVVCSSSIYGFSLPFGVFKLFIRAFSCKTVFHCWSKLSIPALPAYVLYVSVDTIFQGAIPVLFSMRFPLLLSRKLLNQGFVVIKLKWPSWLG